MYRVHESPLDAELVVHHLQHHRDAVGGTGGVGDDVVGGGQGVVVHAHHHRALDGGVVGRTAEDDPPHTVAQVALQQTAGLEASARVDDDAHAAFAPRNLFR